MTKNDAFNIDRSYEPAATAWARKHVSCVLDVYNIVKRKQEAAINHFKECRLNPAGRGCDVSLLHGSSGLLQWSLFD